MVEIMAAKNITLPDPDDEKRGNRLQGWLQSDKAAHKAMWMLGVKHPTALAVLHFMVSKMQRGTNGVVMSASALSSEMGVSSRTIQSTIAVLRDSKFVQVLKTGNTNVYIINSRVAWQGERGHRYASFNAHITVEENEQEKPVDQLIAESEEMVEVPVMEFSSDVVLPDVTIENEQHKKVSTRKKNKLSQGKLELGE